MNKKEIKNSLRKILLKEGDDDSYDYGCVMLYLDVPKKDWDKIQKTIKEEDIYKESGDISYGREESPYITILYGLHNTIPDTTISEIISTIKQQTITLKKIGKFNNTKYDVIKFDIIGEDKKTLTKLNNKFIKLPYTNDFPDYNPHATIAYIKPKKGKKYTKTLSNDDSLVVNCKKIVYSKANGDKKTYRLNKL